MSDALAQATALRNAFDQIEEAYEFILADAAQGRKQETEEGGGESQIRQYVKRFLSALGEVQKALSDGLGGADGAKFCERFQADIETVCSILSLPIGRPSISSDMIDNTNGLITMRALLTDILFVDTAILPHR
ncbi:MAG: hypothetical protein KUG58_09950 [Marinosulfonomonas sp.]|nr:hypothetical protein [Marinosulfonomonas sp.]